MNREEIKKSYLKTPIPERLSTQGWIDLEQKLEDQLPPSTPYLFYIKRVSFALAVLLIFLTVLVSGAQAAQPGDKLYPVKLLADQVKAKITNNPQIPVQNRAQEVINLSKQNSPKLNQAVSQYDKTLNQQKDQAKTPDQKQKLDQSLQTQEQKLEEVQKSQPQNEQIEQAIDQTKKVQGEVKGASIEKQPEGNSPNNSQGHGNSQNSPGHNK